MKIGNRDFDVQNETYIMGILNVTPDSFSDGGSTSSIDDVLYKTEKMITDGADIIDIGGESTRPGAAYVSAAEELSRVLPVIEALKARFDIPLSLDTYKPEVAKAGLDAGIDLANDIWGLKYDSKMADIIAQYNVPACLMHNRKDTCPADVVNTVVDDLKETLNIAYKAGISKDKIILDPGIGFAKDTNQNLTMLNNLEILNTLGCPVLLGCSRKSVIGNTLNVDVKNRLYGTIATTVLAVMKHMAFVRVHDVKENFDAIKMTKAILES